MKFETHNQNSDIQIVCSSYQGQMHASFDDLVAIFGQPLNGDCDKVQVEWHLKFEDGTVATIYDWKRYGTKPEDVTVWNIGGFNSTAARYVREALEQYRDSK